MGDMTMDEYLKKIDLEILQRNCGVTTQDAPAPETGDFTDNISLVKEPEPGTNPKDLLGVQKVQLNLVPPASKVYQAIAMEDGAKKYGSYNWRENKVILSIYEAALERHMMRFHDGEDIDPDSGKPHLAHAIACLGIIIDAKETGNLVDDRPTPGVAAQLLKKWEKKT